MIEIVTGGYKILQMAWQWGTTLWELLDILVSKWICLKAWNEAPNNCLEFPLCGYFVRFKQQESRGWNKKNGR